MTPIILTAISLGMKYLPEIFALIQKKHGASGGNPAVQQTKADEAFKQFVLLLQNLGGSGLIDGKLPSDDQIRAIIETIFQTIRPTIPGKTDSAAAPAGTSIIIPSSGLSFILTLTPTGAATK